MSSFVSNVGAGGCFVHCLRRTIMVKGTKLTTDSVSESNNQTLLKNERNISRQMSRFYCALFVFAANRNLAVSFWPVEFVSFIIPSGDVFELFFCANLLRPCVLLVRDVALK